MLLTKSCSLSAFFVRKMRVPWEMSVAAASLCSWPDHIVVQVGLVVQQDVADWMLVAVLHAGFGCQRIGFRAGKTAARDDGRVLVVAEQVQTLRSHMGSATSTNSMTWVRHNSTWILRPLQDGLPGYLKNTRGLCDLIEFATCAHIGIHIDSATPIARIPERSSHGFCNLYKQHCAAT